MNGKTEPCPCDKDYANECGVVMGKLDAGFLESLILNCDDKELVKKLLFYLRSSLTGCDLTIVDGVRGKR